MLLLCAGTEARNGGIRWDMEVSPVTLSTHQRLIVRVTVRVDSRELEKVRGGNEVSASIRLQDAEGGIWEHRSFLNLSTVQPGMQARDLEANLYFFVLPRDYSLSVTVGGAARTRKLHVAALKSDPLPEAWAGLPPVEFITSPLSPPDIWFLPDIKGKLNLPVKTRRPVHVELLVNTTPSERAAGSVAALRRNMSLLIPALKVFSGMELEGGSVDAALLDLVHRKVVYEQRDVHELDWAAMRRFFVETRPGVIDVKALENQSLMRQYFADEVARRMASEDDRPLVIIVLSGPAFFETQAPYEMPVAAERPERRLIYIRDRFVGSQIRLRPRPGSRPILPRPNVPMAVDDLERALEPLHPHIYDAATGEQFRRILAAVLSQISAM